MRGAQSVAERKPPFTRDQIVTSSDLQRRWRKSIEAKLCESPYLVVFSGSEPKGAVLSYEKFEELWQRAEESAELRLKLEVLARAWCASESKAPLSSLASVMERLGITKEELEAAPDVDIESE